MHTTARQGEHALRDGASTRTDAASPSPGGDLPTTHTIVRVGTNAGAGSGLYAAVRTTGHQPGRGARMSPGLLSLDML